jgi:hypothetical protein
MVHMEKQLAHLLAKEMDSKTILEVSAMAF